MCWLKMTCINCVVDTYTFIFIIITKSLVELSEIYPVSMRRSTLQSWFTIIIITVATVQLKICIVIIESRIYIIYFSTSVIALFATKAWCFNIYYWVIFAWFCITNGIDLIPVAWTHTIIINTFITWIGIEASLICIFR